MSKGGVGTVPLLLGAAAVVLATSALVWLRPPAEPPLRVGQTAPAFRLADLEGEPVGLEAASGHVVFLNFWATWCPPCREEAPSFERLYRSLRDDGFAVLAVSIDEPTAVDDVRAFREEFDLSFPILLDPERIAYDEYQATGVPETFLIDASGRVAERFVGPRDWDDPRYARAIRRLLALSEAGAEAGAEAGG